MNFTEILDEYQIPVAPADHEHSTAGWIQFDCPFCSPDSQRFRMGFNVQYGYVNCWSCGHHPLGETLALLTGLNPGPARDLAHRVEREVTPLRERRQTTPVQLPAGLGPLQEPHLHYLRSRHFHPAEIIRLWNVQGLGIAGRLSWRLFLPISYQGRTVSWTTRSVNPQAGQRYLSAEKQQEAVPHREILYGMDYIRLTVLVCEGPLDVWRFGPGAVATFGIDYTQAQVILLSRIPQRILCFDNEPLAQQRAHRLCDELAPFPGSTYQITLDAKDLAAAPLAEVERIRHFWQHPI